MTHVDSRATQLALRLSAPQWIHMECELPMTTPAREVTDGATHAACAGALVPWLTLRVETQLA
eukprot:4498106-Amphidinium_carterae.6